MTDRERLLEMIAEQEGAAQEYGAETQHWIAAQYDPDGIADYAKDAAHHALTALALRDVTGDTELRCAQVWAHHNRCERPTGHRGPHLLHTGFTWV